MQPDASLITPELQELVGRDSPPHEAAVTPELVRRVLEVVQDDDPRWMGATAPPYVLMAFGADLPLPDSPPASVPLVTGDDWTLYRPLRVGERLQIVGRLASVHERFGSRFGHSLVLRTTWTFADAAGAVVAEVGRGMIRYRPPDQGTTEGVQEAGEGQAGADLRVQPVPSDPGGGPPPVPSPQRLTATEGEALPPAVFRPTLGQVVRYCGLTWNFVPFFFDRDEARRAGLPGTIVPGPLKLAQITRYLATWAGTEGGVRTVRVAYRRPDLTGRPFTVRAVVSRVEARDSGRLVECELWTETATGDRSVMGSALVALPVGSG